MLFTSVFDSVLHPKISQFQTIYFSCQAEDGQEPKVDLFRWDNKERSDEVTTWLLARWLFHRFFILISYMEK